MKKKYCLIFLLFVSSFGIKAEDSLLVDLTGKVDIIVAGDSSGDYTTVQAAINAVPDNSSSRTVVFIKNGTYYEKVRISSTKKNLVIIGEDLDSTIITYDDYAGASGFECATVKVDANNFLAMNITFENSYGEGSQALAMFTNGDCQVFAHCRFVGFQDTYFSGSDYRAYFKDCLFIGAVDFIYGPTTIVFDSCQIHNVRTGGYITAASTAEGNKFGYVFRNCWISGNKGITGIYFGRPWRPYSNVVYYNCYESSCISSIGWHDWGNVDNQSTAFYAEYKCYGPGSDTSKRVAWSHQLTDTEAAEYSLAKIFAKSNNPAVMPSDWMPTVESDSLYSIVKKHTVMFLDPINISAKLSSLKLNNIDVEGFHPDSSLIIVELPSGTTEMPVLTAISDNEASKIEIIYPEEVPNFATINVIAPYYAAYSTYKVYLSVDSSYHSADIVGITMNKTEIPDFDPEVINYTFVVPEGTSLYMPISVTVKANGALSRVVKPAALPGVFEFHVTAIDGITKKVYYVNVTFATSINQLEQAIDLRIENPINQQLKGSVNVAVPGKYSLQIFNISGEKVLDHSLGYVPAKGMSFIVNTEKLISGVYIYKLTGSGGQIVGRLVKSMRL